MNSKITKLYEVLRSYPPFAIAFSGGVDSSFLAAVSSKVGKDQVIALTADSLFQSDMDLKYARRMVEKIGIQHEVIPVDVMSPEIICNGKERCYFCKKKLFGILKQRAKFLGFSVLAHGINMDDLDDYRPGLKAAEEMQILSPLIEAQLFKEEIRRESKKMGLETWNLPSQSCLATRIPHGEPITREKLVRIEICEAYLHSLGFNGIRVRCYGDMARIECPSEIISRIAESDIRQEVIRFFNSNGFNFVALDLGGYVSGNMNPQ